MEQEQSNKITSFDDFLAELIEEDPQLEIDLEKAREWLHGVLGRV